MHTEERPKLGAVHRQAAAEVINTPGVLLDGGGGASPLWEGTGKNRPDNQDCSLTENLPQCMAATRGSDKALPGTSAAGNGSHMQSSRVTSSVHLVKHHILCRLQRCAVTAQPRTRRHAAEEAAQLAGNGGTGQTLTGAIDAVLDADGFVTLEALGQERRPHSEDMSAGHLLVLFLGLSLSLSALLFVFLLWGKKQKLESGSKKNMEDNNL